MTGMDDLVTWVRAQMDARVRELDEDERVALAGIGDNISPAEEWHHDGHVGVVHNGLGDTVVDGDSGAAAEHIARWDPERVLRLVAEGRAEVEAVRRILDLHAPVHGYDPNGPVCSTCGESGNPGDESAVVPWPCLTVRLLALPMAGREGYRDEWIVR